MISIPIDEGVIVNDTKTTVGLKGALLTRRSPMNRRRDRIKLLGLLAIPLGALLIAGPSFAGISQPSMVILGGLFTPGGQEITTGQMEFVFSPESAGEPVTVKVDLRHLRQGVSFLARLAVESAPVSRPERVLALGASCTTQVFYNDQEIAAPQFPSPLTVECGEVIGPLSLTFAQPAPLLEVSADIDFGHVLLNSYAEQTFQIGNIGTALLTGTARLKDGVDFRITEGGITVAEAPIQLEPDETMDIVVRFQPVSIGSDLMDQLQVHTNAGDTERIVEGSCGTAVSFSPADFNYDRDVDAVDLFMLIEEMKTGGTSTDMSNDGKVDHDDCFIFSNYWGE